MSRKKQRFFLLPLHVLATGLMVAMPAHANGNSETGKKLQYIISNPGPATPLEPAEEVPAPDADAAAVPGQDIQGEDRYIFPAGDSLTLGPEDQIRMNVYGEAELSGDYLVDSSGSIAVPLIGAVKVEGLTLRQAEKAVAEKLADGYLVSPSVSMQTARRRPFYIMGAVRAPGSYSFVSDMIVMSAIAMAGGFAAGERGAVEILRPEGDERTLYRHVAIDAPVKPGDIILVK